MTAKRAILEAMYNQLSLQFNLGMAMASVYRMGIRTSETGPAPMLIRETDLDKANRLERMLGPRMDRLSRLIMEEGRAET
jgi:hypothetical protein